MGKSKANKTQIIKAIKRGLSWLQNRNLVGGSRELDVREILRRLPPDYTNLTETQRQIDNDRIRINNPRFDLFGGLFGHKPFDTINYYPSPQERRPVRRVQSRVPAPPSQRRRLNTPPPSPPESRESSPPRRRQRLATD